MFSICHSLSKTPSKWQADENMTELDIGNNDSKEYKVGAMWDGAVYTKKSESVYLPGFYNLIL